MDLSFRLRGYGELTRGAHPDPTNVGRSLSHPGEFLAIFKEKLGEVLCRRVRHHPRQRLTPPTAPSADATPSAAQASFNSNGGDDVFLWKLDSVGNFVYVKIISGPSFQEAGGMEIDASGNVYLTGDSWAATVDFDPGSGTFPLTATGFSEAFALKLSSSIQYALGS